MPELKVERMVGRDTVKRIEFDHLVQGNQSLDEGGDIVIEFPQIDVDSLNNSVQQLGQFFHNGSLILYSKKLKPLNC
jgi:hypothetical protein